MAKQPANCLGCQHLFVTWDPARPRGCRALGFKCRELPCQVVKHASGEVCQYFRAKLGKRTPEHRNG